MSAPDNERDLALIDAALAAGRATSSDPRERELEELALALHEESPRPDPAFARELGRRVEEGFAKPRRFRLPTMRMPRARMPILAGAAAALIALVVAVGVLQGGGQEDAGTQIAQDPPAGAEPAPQPAIGETAPPGGSDVEPGDATSSGTRRVERSAEMTLAGPADELQDMASGVARVAEQHRGYVQSSRISTGDDSAGGGTFVLRIPTSRLETALSELGELGTVKARSESSQDMTAPYKATQDRLGNLLLERRTIEDKLEDASGDEEIELRSQLRAVSAEIRDVSSRMDDLKQRTLFSTVTVSIEEAEGDAGAGAGSGPGGAWDDAVATLTDVLEFAIRALGVILPLGVVALLGWLGGRMLRRRRREAALF
jgi:hypothetical protein